MNDYFNKYKRYSNTVLKKALDNWYSPRFNSLSDTIIKKPRWTVYENWMNDYMNNIKFTPLNEISLPGSHDSGTYELYTDEIYNDKDFTGISQAIAAPIIRRYAITQEVDIYTQLMEGNRYIDLRFAKDRHGKMRIVHTVFGNGPEMIFNQIYNFLTKHPTEVVIIDLQHLWNLDSSDKKTLKKIIIERIGPHLAPRATFNSYTPISEYISSGKNSILLFDDNATVKEEPLFWYRNDSIIKNPWYNTDNIYYLTESLDKAMIKVPKEKKYFYVSQLLLTVTPEYVKNIILHGHGGSLKDLTLTHRQTMDDWVKSRTNKKNPPYNFNIIIRDFYTQNSIKYVVENNKQ